jgi:hypothetical protein
MIWAGHVTRMGEKRNDKKPLWESKERDHQEDIDIRWMIILKCIIEKLIVF